MDTKKPTGKGGLRRRNLSTRKTIEALMAHALPPCKHYLEQNLSVSFMLKATRKVAFKRRVEMDQAKFASEAGIDESQIEKLEISDLCGLEWSHDDNGYSVWRASRNTCVIVDTPAPYGGSTSMTVNLRANDTINIKLNNQGIRCC